MKPKITLNLNFVSFIQVQVQKTYFSSTSSVIGSFRSDMSVFERGKVPLHGRPLLRVGVMAQMQDSRKGSDWIGRSAAPTSGQSRRKWLNLGKCCSNFRTVEKEVI